MQKGRQNSQRQKLQPVINFLEQTIAMDLPGNTVIFIDTHSCVNTGCLQYGGSKAAPMVVDVNQVSGFPCFRLYGFTHLICSWSMVSLASHS